MVTTSEAGAMLEGVAESDVEGRDEPRILREEGTMDTNVEQVWGSVGRQERWWVDGRK